MLIKKRNVLIVMNSYSPFFVVVSHIDWICKIYAYTNQILFTEEYIAFTGLLNVVQEIKPELGVIKLHLFSVD